MSLLNERGSRDFSEYDAMSTEALEEILRQVPLDSEEGEFDTEKVLYISQLVAERDKGTNRCGNAEASWADFKRKYLSPEASVKPVTPVLAGKRPRRAVKTVLIAAVVCVLLIGTAFAAGILGWLPRWDEELFSFEKEEPAAEATAQDSEYATLEEALAAYDAPGDIVPSYIPEGYEFEDFEYFVDAMGNINFGEWYEKNGNTIGYNYTLILNINIGGGYTKDEGDPEVYRFHGIDHYIMTNVGKYLAVWQRENFECSISGYESRDDLIKAIESIYTEE